MPSGKSDRTSSFAFSRLPLPARDFGNRIVDLNFDFQTPDRVGLAIRIVAASLHDADEDPDATEARASALPLSVRILQLLRLVSTIEGTKTLELTRSCPRPDCAEPIELALPLEGLIEYGARPVTARTNLAWSVPGASGTTITLRRPTGDDQRGWQKRRYTTRAEAARHLLETIAVDGREHLDTMSREAEGDLANAMSEFDPLVGFQMSTECPHCDQPVTLPVDLEDACLLRLEREHRCALDTIHELAASYGWTESEILRIPRNRRRHYLNRIHAATSVRRDPGATTR